MNGKQVDLLANLWYIMKASAFSSPPKGEGQTWSWSPSFERFLTASHSWNEGGIGKETHRWRSPRPEQMFCFKIFSTPQPPNPRLIVHLFQQSRDPSACHHTCPSWNCLANVPGESHHLYWSIFRFFIILFYLSEEQSSSVISSGSIPSSSIACLRK